MHSLPLQYSLALWSLNRGLSYHIVFNLPLNRPKTPNLRRLRLLLAKAYGGHYSAIPFALCTLAQLEESASLHTVSLYLCQKFDFVDAYLARHPPSNQLRPDAQKKTLVILGSGWGSTSLLKSLNTEGYNVIVVSPRNYFLFTRNHYLKICADR